jgi:hypothetical protein
MGASSAASATGSTPLSSASPNAPRYHRFPAHSQGQRATQARAFNAFFAANTARQLLPANENAGALNPSIREED